MSVNAPADEQQYLQVPARSGADGQPSPRKKVGFTRSALNLKKEPLPGAPAAQSGSAGGSFTPRSHDSVGSYDHTKPPPDKHNVAYWILVLLGAGLLFPWNSFISAPDYFTYYYQSNIEFLFAMVYTVPNFLGLLLMIWIGNRFSFVGKVFVWFSVALVILVITPLVPTFGMPEIGRLIFVLGLVFIQGFGTAVLQASMFGFAALMPAIYSQALMGGNGFAGVIVSVLRLITKAALAHSSNALELSGLIYFVLSAFIVLLCIIAFWILLKLPFTRFYITQNPVDSLYEQPLMQDEAEATDSEASEEAIPLKEGDALRFHSNTPASYGGEQDLEHAAKVTHKANLWHIFKKRWVPAFSVFYTFFVSLAVFPGIATSITPDAFGGWFSVIIVTVFNVFDTIGRLSPAWFKLSNEKWLLAPVLARSIFLPAFVLCIKPQVFASPWWALSFMAVMAFTNGHFGSLSMMLGPSHHCRTFEKELCGTMMTACLLLGITVGSFGGMGISAAV